MERASSSSDSSSMACSSSSSDQSLSINSDQTSPFVASSSMLSRTSSSSSSAVGDYIGTESCFDILSADEGNDVVSVPSESVKSRFRYGGRRREEREARAAAAREFPPPIPLLAQTGNLLPHMPWVLKRVVTSDGRLILREEKVRHHEYFRADRSNGRLTLHLVPLDDDVFELPQEPSHYQTDDDDDDDHEEEEENDEDDGNECDDDDHQDVDLDDLADTLNKSVTITSPNVDDDEDKGNVHGEIEDGYRKAILAAVGVEETVVDSGVLIGGGGGGGGSPRGKCLKSCFVGMRIQEIRPVLS
ncbi:PREDICTED: protein FANTASTIC FOUR 3-like [Camelina sativa]|uniref:Protein FANTASTIC FOUR 3-like n=1 Tax=Camelina sativa TaxID=90675 RepID=A0ABM0YBU9_CAMSA|nr:PREDICTED: protein FANTASTIC FOUR 3-like [Camelina sativa]